MGFAERLQAAQERVKLEAEDVERVAAEQKDDWARLLASRRIEGGRRAAVAKKLTEVLLEWPDPRFERSLQVIDPVDLHGYDPPRRGNRNRGAARSRFSQEPRYLDTWLLGSSIAGFESTETGISSTSTTARYTANHLASDGLIYQVRATIPRAHRADQSEPSTLSMNGVKLDFQFLHEGIEQGLVDLAIRKEQETGIHIDPAIFATLE